MLNEEAVRLVLKCVDRKKLQLNSETGNRERDGEVFVSAARWLDFHGESWVRNEGMFCDSNKIQWFIKCVLVESDRSRRRHRSTFKNCLVLRRLLRSRGFLVDFANASQPFYSIDLTQVGYTFT